MYIVVSSYMIFFFSSNKCSTLYEYYTTIYPLSDLGKLLAGKLSKFFILESLLRKASSTVLWDPGNQSRFIWIDVNLLLTPTSRCRQKPSRVCVTGV